MDDGQLLARCRRGEQAAWACLIDRYERLVYSIPLNLGLNLQDAEDVTQTTFAQLLASLDRIQEPDRVGAWLSTVSKRQSIRLIEQRVRERDRIVAAAAVSEIDHGGIESLVEDIEWLHQGVSRLTPRCQALLIELYFSGSSYEEAAVALAVPIGSVGPTRNRCLDSLKKALASL